MVKTRLKWVIPTFFTWAAQIFAAGIERSFLLGWSDPRLTLATESCAKVGSLQPSTVFCPCPKSIVASCATSAPPITSVHRGGERKGEPHSEPRLSCAVHPSTPEETIKIRCHRHTSTIKEASKTEKRKRGFWPRATRICRKCFDGRESIESPLLTREHPEGKKVEKNICTSTFFRRVCQAMKRPEEGRPKAQQ